MKIEQVTVHEDKAISIKGNAVRYVESGTYLVEMPDDYSPERIVPEDLVCDRQLRTIERIGQ